MYLTGGNRHRHSTAVVDNKVHDHPGFILNGSMGASNLFRAAQAQLLVRPIVRQIGQARRATARRGTDRENSAHGAHRERLLGSAAPAAR